MRRSVASDERHWPAIDRSISRAPTRTYAGVARRDSVLPTEHGRGQPVRRRRSDPRDGQRPATRARARSTGRPA